MTLRDIGRWIVRAVPILDRLARRVYTSLPAGLHDTPTRRMADYFKGEENVSFVQIGAFDGVAGDPIRELVMARTGWRGALVEPQAAVFQSLRRNYASRAETLVFFNVAVAASAGERTLYSVMRPSTNEAELPDWAGEVASFDLAHVRKHFPSAAIAAQAVTTMTFAEIAESLPKGIVDVVVMDVEGYERALIESIDFDRHRTRFIVFEHVHLDAPDTARIAARLKAARFWTKAFGRDTIAWRSL